MDYIGLIQKADSTKAYSTSEESEFNALKYDLDHGMKLPEHKMNRYLELKQKLGKCKNLGLCPKALYLLIIN